MGLPYYKPSSNSPQLKLKILTIILQIVESGDCLRNSLSPEAATAIET